MPQVVKFSVMRFGAWCFVPLSRLWLLRQPPWLISRNKHAADEREPPPFLLSFLLLLLLHFLHFFFFSFSFSFFFFFFFVLTSPPLGFVPRSASFPQVYNMCHQTRLGVNGYPGGNAWTPRGEEGRGEGEKEGEKEGRRGPSNEPQDPARSS